MWALYYLIYWKSSFQGCTYQQNSDKVISKSWATDCDYHTGAVWQHCCLEFDSCMSGQSSMHLISETSNVSTSEMNWVLLVVWYWSNCHMQTENKITSTLVNKISRLCVTVFLHVCFYMKHYHKAILLLLLLSF